MPDGRIDDAPALSAAAREAALWHLTGHELDVLVIGGGVVGSGVALDAATRGFSVGLVEARDIGSGTSSRSSKLIHGGVRYLEQLQIGLVREALRERKLLLHRIAPHLVSPVRFVYPLTRRFWERLYVGAGLQLYDNLGGAGAVPRHHHLSRAGLQRAVPGMKSGMAVGALTYVDAQVDDARFALTLARTAAAHGAHICSGARVLSLLRGRQGAVCGARVYDTVSGAEFDVRARHVISAAGVWNEEIAQLAGTEGLRIRASKGVHVTVPRSAVDSTTGLITRTDRSVLFVIPWRDHWILGTTDTPWTGDRAHPAATRSDIDFLLAQANRWLSRPLTIEDIHGVTAGLRPLVHRSGNDTARLSREHVVVQPVRGLSIIAGGKLTTYRVMAADAVDVAAKELGSDAPSHTRDITLLGSVGLPRAGEETRGWAARSGLSVTTAEHLLSRYGTLADDVVATAHGDRSLLEPITGGGRYLRAEILHAAGNEAVLHLDDLLTRRTRIALETPDRGAEAAAEVARLAAPLLGWSPERVQRETANYQARLLAERSAERAPEDELAERARSAWRDPRLPPLPQ